MCEPTWEPRCRRRKKARLKNPAVNDSRRMVKTEEAERRAQVIGEGEKPDRRGLELATASDKERT